MGCMVDTESSVQSDLDDKIFEKIDQEKRDTASSFHQEYNYVPQKIELNKKKSQDYLTIDQNIYQEMKDYEKFLQEYMECSDYYMEHDIDSAYISAVNLQKKLKDLKQIIKYSDEEIPLNQNNIQQIEKLIQKVKRQFSDVQAYQKQIYKDGWIKKSNKKGIKISTRREQQTVGVLVQSIIDVPCQALIAILIQMSLYRLFIPFMEISTQQKIISRNCRLGYSLSKIPLLTRRQAFYQGIAYNRLKKHNSLFLFTRSIHNRQDTYQQFNYKPNINKDYIQLNYKYFVVKYQPITKNRGKIILAMNVDTKLQLVPLWLQDKISQDYGENFLLNITKLSKKFKGSIWQKNVRQNPHMYNFCKEKIHEYLEEKQNIAKKD